MPAQRELSYKVSENGCWICISHKAHPWDYPLVRINGKREAAHRVMYKRHVAKSDNPIPVGLIIRHTCDNKHCINPDHLIIGTPAENSHDMVVRRRSIYGSNHLKAKLSDNDVIQIRLLDKPIAIIASEYNVSKSLVGQIKQGTIWKHLLKLNNTSDGKHT